MQVPNLDNLDPADRWYIESTQESQKEWLTELVEQFRRLVEVFDDTLVPTALVAQLLCDHPDITHQKLVELVVVSVKMMAENNE